MCPRLPWSHWTLALAVGCGWLLWAPPSAAQVPAAAPDATAQQTEGGARQHFDRALELYRAGHYAEALEQLERAARLDPGGKDLFFNLSLVHEKLGQLPQAIAALERFQELEPDAAERERARLTIERLRGAERAAYEAQAVSPACPSAAPVPTPAAAKTPNVVLIGAASVAVVSLVVGALFGAQALDDDIGQTGTSATVSVDQLRARGRRAQREALIADVAFALGAAAGGTFAAVWLLSPSHATERAAGITLRSEF